MVACGPVPLARRRGGVQAGRRASRRPDYPGSAIAMEKPRRSSPWPTVRRRAPHDHDSQHQDVDTPVPRAQYMRASAASWPGDNRCITRPRPRRRAWGPVAGGAGAGRWQARRISASRAPAGHRPGPTTRWPAPGRPGRPRRPGRAGPAGPKPAGTRGRRRLPGGPQHPCHGVAPPGRGPQRRPQPHRRLNLAGGVGHLSTPGRPSLGQHPQLGPPNSAAYRARSAAGSSPAATANSRGAAAVTWRCPRPRTPAAPALTLALLRSRALRW